MRIIKAAKKTDEFITSCKQCKSILGVREVDLKWINMNWAFECPVCDIINNIDNDKAELFPWIMEDENDWELPSDNTMREYSL